MSSFFLYDFKCSQFQYINYLFNNSIYQNMHWGEGGGDDEEKDLFTLLARQKWVWQLTLKFLDCNRN